MLLNKIEGNIPTLLDVTTYSELNPKPGEFIEFYNLLTTIIVKNYI